MDGGGETPIEGSDATARGSTTAAYGITKYPTTLLIDRKGQVVSEFHPRNREHVNMLRQMVGVPTDGSPFALTHIPKWRGAV